MNKNVSPIYEKYKKLNELIFMYEKNLNYSLVDEIENKFIILIEEIQSLLLIKHDLYYGHFLINIKYSFFNKEDFLAGVTFQNKIVELVINPIKLGKMKLKEIIFVLCHEVEHLIYGHQIEMLKMNPNKDGTIAKLLNIAMDASVNDKLLSSSFKRLNLITAPPGIITSDYIREVTKKQINSNSNFLYYYDKIKDCADFLKELEESSSSFSYNDSIENNIDLDQQRKNKNQELSNNNSINGNSNILDDIYNSIDEDNMVSGKLCKKCLNSYSDINFANGNDDFEIIKDIMGIFFEKVINQMPEKTRGNFRIDYSEYIEKFKKKERLNWKKILKEFIGNVPDEYRKTVMRLNRRQPDRYELKGRIQEYRCNIVIAIDTSGSMDNHILSVVLNEVLNIIKNKKTLLTIIECDMTIQKVYTVKNKSDIDYKLLGRGGTYFTPVFEYLNNDKKYRKSLLIYFTDGGGENKIPKPLNYRTLWVLCNSNYLSVSEPYGKVLKISKKDIGNI